MASASAEVVFRPQDFQTPATFELTVTRSTVLKPGASRIVTMSAFATLTHGLMPGNSDGLEILFFTQPITDAARVDILERGARELRSRDHAALVLFLDKDKRVWQVNASYVTRGKTVGRTVAWTPDDLKQFAHYRFDGTRLTLKSQGRYVDANSGDEQLSLSWEVDVNLPVFHRARK
jgi:hypothetical protein